MINSAARSSITSKAQYRKMSAGNPQYSEMELIATAFIGTTGPTSVTFDISTLASSYKHLQIRSAARSTNTGDDSLRIVFNGDIATNYTFHQLLGNGSSVSSGAGTALPAMYPVFAAGTNSASNIFNPGIIDILDPFSSTKNKTVRGFSGQSDTASSLALRSGLWISTAVVTSILVSASTGTLVAGTRISLYGIKG